MKTLIIPFFFSFLILAASFSAVANDGLTIEITDGMKLKIIVDNQTPQDINLSLTVLIKSLSNVTRLNNTRNDMVPRGSHFERTYHFLTIQKISVYVKAGDKQVEKHGIIIGFFILLKP